MNKMCNYPKVIQTGISNSTRQVSVLTFNLVKIIIKQFNNGFKIAVLLKREFFETRIYIAAVKSDLRTYGFYLRQHMYSVEPLHGYCSM